MHLLALLHMTAGLAALPPMRPDTPPPPPVPVSRLAQLKTMEDVRSVTLLADGTRAPAELRLPELRNRQETMFFMLSRYPASMRGRATSTVPLAWVLVERMRFSPALNGDEPVDAWIEVPIEFKDRQR